MLRTLAAAALVALGPLVLMAPAPHDALYSANGVPTGSELIAIRAARLSVSARDALTALHDPGAVARDALGSISQAAGHLNAFDPVFGR